MYNPDFENQYTNFFVAYAMAYTGYMLYIRDGIYSFSVVFIILSIFCFTYFFKTTILRLIKRIKQGQVTVLEGIQQYIAAMFRCVLLVICLSVLMYFGRKFWQLRLF